MIPPSVVVVNALRKSICTNPDAVSAANDMSAEKDARPSRPSNITARQHKGYIGDLP